jgi:hypothetical protein
MVAVIFLYPFCNGYHQSPGPEPPEAEWMSLRFILLKIERMHLQAEGLNFHYPIENIKVKNRPDSVDF